MKWIAFVLLGTMLHAGYAQRMFSYEQEIAHKELYNFKEIDFLNTAEDIQLSGTLITPKTSFSTIVIIVPGSGRDTRYAHFMLAETFLQKGIAVYRFDERGLGTSKGKFSTTATALTTDLTYAIQKLRSLHTNDTYKIGVLGHSLGGIASIGAYEQAHNIDFLIQMSTPVAKEGAFFKYQTQNEISDFYSIKGKSKEEVLALLELFYPIIVAHTDFKTIRNKAKKVAKEHGYKRDFHQFLSPTHIDIVKQNHEATYQTLNIPTLYIIGGNDLFVDPVSETALLHSFQNPNIAITVIPKLNHYLTDREATAGSSLYQMDKEALNTIMEWTLTLSD